MQDVCLMTSKEAEFKARNIDCHKS